MMRVWGAVLQIVGVIWIAIAYMLDTSKGGTYNIGLIAQQQANLLVAGVIIICGTMLIGFDSVVEAIQKGKIKSRATEPVKPEPVKGSWGADNNS